MIDANDVNTPSDADPGLVESKLLDAENPGFVGTEFDPSEADWAGAFVEEALAEADALDSAPELMDAV